MPVSTVSSNTRQMIVSSSVQQVKGVKLRLARESDAHDIAGFYAPYVERTAINFEYSAPTAEEFATRIQKIGSRYPFIVAERNDSHIVGYVFAHAMGDRPAYAWSAENSIYIDQKYRGCHIGSALYLSLEAFLKAQNVVNLFSCITVRHTDGLEDIGGWATESGVRNHEIDPHLPETSPRFHAALGYRIVGREFACGYKFDTWYDKLWMEKTLHSRSADPKPFISITELSFDRIVRLLGIGTQTIQQMTRE